MRLIERTSAFKKDYKNASKGKSKEALLLEFPKIVTKLANDQSIEVKYKDHALTGDWNDHRDCHIRPDLILIYRK